MADLDELYAKNKAKQKRKFISNLALIAISVLLALVLSFYFRAPPGERVDTLPAYIANLFFWFICALMIVFGGKGIVNLYKSLNASSITTKTAASSNLILNDLEDLENERIELLKLIRKANVIAAIAGLIVGVFVGYYFDVVFRVFLFSAVFVAIRSFMVSSKEMKFNANFKERVLGAIVKSYGLKFDKFKGLSLDDFFTIYHCRVDRQRSEDLIYGEIDGVSVKFSDFYAVKDVKTKKGSKTVVQFQGVLFKADFHKKLNSITQICHKKSSNLARYGKRANMDDVKFEEFFNVYTTDQIEARYALTPALMQQLIKLHLSLGSPINVVFKGSEIYIAIETWGDNFEPDLKRSLSDDETIALYESEIAGFAQIVRELNLNRRIWA